MVQPLLCLRLSVRNCSCGQNRTHTYPRKKTVLCGKCEACLLISFCCLQGSKTDSSGTRRMWLSKRANTVWHDCRKLAPRTVFGGFWGGFRCRCKAVSVWGVFSASAESAALHHPRGQGWGTCCPPRAASPVLGQLGRGARTHRRRLLPFEPHLDSSLQFPALSLARVVVMQRLTASAVAWRGSTGGEGREGSGVIAADVGFPLYTFVW